MSKEKIAEKNGYRVYLYQDNDARNPRVEYDNVGTMVCWHRRYKLGDQQPKENYRDWLRSLVDADEEWSDEQVQEAVDQRFIFLPLYLYDHSGITISTGPFGCPWDSGQVGWIYVSLDKAKEEWGDDKEAAIKYLKGEVETYDQYLRGEVYGYVLHGPDGVEDSCCGFYGYENAKQEAVEACQVALRCNG
jgi:hypothetical protein